MPKIHAICAADSYNRIFRATMVSVDTRAKQVFVDIWLKKPFNDDFLRSLVKIIRTKLSVLKEARYDFQPQGTTHLFVLSESHAAIHTYPEENYLALDLYVCNLSTPVEKIVDACLAVLPIESTKRSTFERGVKTAV